MEQMQEENYIKEKRKWKGKEKDITKEMKRNGEMKGVERGNTANKGNEQGKKGN